MPIEIGAKTIGPVSAIAAIEARITSVPGNADTKPAVSQGANPAVFDKSPFAPGEAPFNAERVSEIRKAIEHGDYPVIPMRVADAMIAAGLLLRTMK